MHLRGNCDELISQTQVESQRVSGSQIVLKIEPGQPLAVSETVDRIECVGGKFIRAPLQKMRQVTKVIGPVLSVFVVVVLDTLQIDTRSHVMPASVEVDIICNLKDILWVARGLAGL